MPKQISQTEFAAKKRDADGMAYTVGDGPTAKTFTVDPPLLWTDEQRRMIRATQDADRGAQDRARVLADKGVPGAETADDEIDRLNQSTLSTVAALLGSQAAADDFVAAGGDPRLFLAAWNELTGTSPGE